MGHMNRRRYAIGENPPDGAILYYYLKEQPKDPIKLEILDASGKAIRSYTSEGSRSLPVRNGNEMNPPNIFPPKPDSTPSHGISAIRSR